MLCPVCQHTDSRVLESRSTEDGSIRRRRECLNPLCRRRFTTHERIEFVPITVIKRDGSKECFDRSKLLRGIVRACEKTDVTEEKIQEIIDEIEAHLQGTNKRKIIVSSEKIGEMVLCYLRSLNEVAYVRFASVYRQFKGVKDFADTLRLLELESLEVGATPTVPPRIDCTP